MKELLQQALMGDYPQLVAAAPGAAPPAAPMPEPVAYRSSRNNGKTWIITEGDPTDLMPDVGGIVVPLYAAPPTAPAMPLCRAVDVGFRFDGAKQEHVPTLLLEFEPVPVGMYNSARGWQDRDALVKMIAAAPSPVVPLTDEQLAKIAVEDEFLLYCDQDEFNEIARAIELAHGIGGGK